MQVKKIHSMWWGGSDRKFVGLVADTDIGDALEIGTPYDETSIIWDAIKEFPVSEIHERSEVLGE